MKLSNDLISQFVKITNDTPKQEKESVVYGVVKAVEDGKPTMVLIDGASEVTPVLSTVNAKYNDKTEIGDRVIIQLKNHTAIVTGNLQSPSATSQEAQDAQNAANNAASAVGENTKKIAEFELVIADKASLDQLYAAEGRIKTLETDNVKVNDTLKVHNTDIENLKAATGEISKLSAIEADIEELTAKDVEIEGTLTAQNGEITSLKTDKLDTTEANAKFATITKVESTYATIASLNSANAKITELETDRITASEAEVKFANIDFSNIGEAAVKKILSDTGLIKDIVVGDGTITGKLVGVTITGDLIEGNTVVADKLVIKGDDGLYYKLNTDGIKTEAEQTDYNSLNGSIIKAKSITATKISVDDLVAFDATIGGFNISNTSLYSGVKSSVDNTTQGIYLDKEGQMSVGDSNNFIKYYKDQNGTYKLEITANSIVLGTSKKSVESAINEVKDSVNNIEVGGRNFILGSKSLNETSATNYNDKLLLDNGFTAFTCTGNWHGVKRDAKDIILDSKDGDVFTFSVNIKTSDICKLSFYAMCYTAEKQRVYPDCASGQFNSMSVVTTNAAEEQDQRVYITFPVTQGWIDLINDGGTIDWTLQVHDGASSINPAYLYAPKLERGNKPTDWTPAPEDMATTAKVEEVMVSAENANKEASEAKALIEVLSESISMLVTDGSGASLMTQTEDGWTFSTGDIQNLVNTTSENLSALTQEIGDVSGTVDILQQAVNDLGTIAEYVKIGTYEDEPCIELGEGDSEFKLRITNTRMIFTEGSSVLAYFNNQSLHIKKAVVEEELQQGGYVWKARANGNLGLTWKGGNN